MKKYIILFSHSNYLLKTTGTEKSMREIAQILKKNNIECLQVFSFSKSLGVKAKKTQYVGVNLGEKFLGVYNIENIPYLINKLYYKLSYVPIGIQLHHLLNYDLKDLQYIISLLNLPIHFFVHDFYTVCKSVNMIDSNGVQCEVSFPCEAKCSSCLKYSTAKLLHLSMIEFINNLDYLIIDFIVPSKYVYEKWTIPFKKYKSKTYIRAHMIYREKYQLNDKVELPISIAFLGAQSQIKGYKEFKNIVEKLHLLNVYKFYYFGIGQNIIPHVENVEVSTITQGSNAMIDKLRALNVDYTFLWSRCPETYSYTYYESSMAGSCIITNKNSGNIKVMVEENKNGKIFDNINQMIEYFSDVENVIKDLLIFKEEKKYSPLIGEINSSLTHISFENQSFTPPNQFYRKKIKNYLFTFLYILKNKVRF